jgi:hypothetical protein
MVIAAYPHGEYRTSATSPNKYANRDRQSRVDVPRQPGGTRLLAVVSFWVLL